MFLRIQSVISRVSQGRREVSSRSCPEDFLASRGTIILL